MQAEYVVHWKESLAELGPVFAKRSASYDSGNEFVAENYSAMREAKLFSAMVPTELGGGGASYSQVCGLVRELARSCGPTALTFAMHQHLVAAAVFNYRHGKPGEALLRAVAGGEKVLVSTGASDWLQSNGTMVRCDGGYRITARKIFASGCLAGDVLVTSGLYEDPEAGPQVLHFPVPMKSEGVSIDRVWDTMGMRGTGSHTVVLNNVFVPEPSIGLRRPIGTWHPVWSLVISVALPMICAAYVGIGEEGARRVREAARGKEPNDILAILLGEMENELTTAQLALDSIVSNVNDLDFSPSLESANRAFIRKTIVVESVIRTMSKALEASGGSGYFRKSGIEQMLRDVEAGQFHPLPAKKQQRFTGRLAMGLEPV